MTEAVERNSSANLVSVPYPRYILVVVYQCSIVVAVYQYSISYVVVTGILNHFFYSKVHAVLEC